MDRLEDAITNESPIDDADDAVLAPLKLVSSEFEDVLTCPGYDNAIRWQPGERLHHLFEQRCAQLHCDGLADHRAIVTDDAILTYGALDHRANQLARYLLKQGVGPADRVGLIFSKSVWTYIAMLAVMKIQAAYVPLDPGFPKDRIAFIAQDADIKRVLTTANLRDHLAALPVPVISLDDEQARIHAEAGDPLHELEGSGSADGICYIIYTSGSTGKPKGVAVEHSSICNFVRAATEAYGLTPDDRVYQGMTIAFDFSVEEIWVPLYSGATLIPGPPGPSLVGKDLSDFLRTRSVSALCCVPTLLATLDEDLPGLRFILVSGEACPHNLIERWHRDDRTFLNVYGPTEATVTATWTLLYPRKPVTIGVPLPTYAIVILDPDAPKLVRKGAAGEIGIAGIGLARGYVNRDDLTAKAFIPDFLGLPNNPSGRIYRTGDLGRITGDGEIEYLGRIDTQVKIRGYRIELAEIESVLMKVPGIAQAVVNTYEPTPGLVELVAYYTLRQDVDALDPEEIFTTIRGHLPSYMLPSFFEPMTVLPMLPSDKVDRKRLPPPSGPRYQAKKTRFVAPANAIERDAARILADLLGLEQVSVEDHFFDDLGANSLLMARFCAAVRERLNCSDVSMREVYLHPSIRSFSAFLATRTRAEPPPVRHEDIHIATNGQYYLCGLLQFVFYFVYSSAMLVAGVEAFIWVSSTNDFWDAYLRAASFGAGMFLLLTIMPVALKWALIGKWQAERIPIWSLRYFRFWVVKQLLRANPMVMFKGSPLYNIYLRMLGARIGRHVVIYSPVLPICTDLLSIGDNTIIRKDSNLQGYRARSGYIETGSISIGRNAFVGEATVLDIDTAIGDGAQLGHTSSLHRGQSVPAGKRYHGSPAQETALDYAAMETKSCTTLRRAAYSSLQLLILFGSSLPLPFVAMNFILLWLGFETGGDGIIHAGSRFLEIGFQFHLLLFSLAAFFGSLLFGLLFIATVPRLLNLFIREDRTYVLYGIHYMIAGTISGMTNSRFFNMVFGDSSYIIYYLKWIGYKLSLSDQTGSNFGVEQKHDTPFLCEIGNGTLVSDGLSMINAHVSNSSFRLSKVYVGSNSFFGNNILYPAGGKTGDNCLLGTKAMVPLDGPKRQDTGLLGSPCFEIPRSVVRDKKFEHYRSGPTFKERLFKKNISNTITMLLYLLAQWFFIHLVLLIAIIQMRHYDAFGWIGIVEFVIIVPALAVAYYSLVERASIRFGKLEPRFCSIYDDYFWKHEHYWKLCVRLEAPIFALFNGTPFKGMIWRLLGVKLGKKLYDDGCGIPERSLTEIGDNCTINYMVTIQGHSLEDGTFKSDHIRIGDGCTIGCTAFVHYGVVMADNVVLDPDSFLMKGEILASNTAWRGNPAKQI